jgi:hypothetical protein
MLSGSCIWQICQMGGDYQRPADSHRWWDLRTLKETAKLDLGKPVSSMELAHGGGTLSVTAGNDVHFLDILRLVPRYLYIPHPIALRRTLVTRLTQRFPLFPSCLETPHRIVLLTPQSTSPCDSHPSPPSHLGLSPPFPPRPLRRWFSQRSVDARLRSRYRKGEGSVQGAPRSCIVCEL